MKRNPRRQRAGRRASRQPGRAAAELERRTLKHRYGLRLWLVWAVMVVGGTLWFGSAWAQQPRHSIYDDAEAVVPAAFESTGTTTTSSAEAAGREANGSETRTGEPLPVAVDEVAGWLGDGPEEWTSPQRLSSTLQIMLLLTVLTLAPAVMLMTTSFVRIIVVLGLLRQALGTQQLPPSQVLTSLALFMTLLIMGPVWKEVYDDAIEPYTNPQVAMSWEDAFARGATPMKRFMGRQIDAAGNSDDVHLFLSYMRNPGPTPQSYEEVPLQALLPAYMLSELKVAFLIGFQIYLPFLILDVVISSVTISMGMLMLPPVIVSLPFKLLLFVLVDGWRLVVQMLLDSFGTGAT